MVMTRSKLKERDGKSYIRKDVDKASRKRKMVAKGQQGKKKKIEEEDTIKEGDVVDLSHLLFTKRRDYLIKYKNNELVKTEQLAGKFIVLHLVSLVDHNYWKTATEELVDIYNVMQPRGDFEVFFVAIRDTIARRGNISTPGKQNTT